MAVTAKLLGGDAQLTVSGAEDTITINDLPAEMQ